ncbi:MAG: TonB family protein [Acetobacteraceae bacterium]
MTSGSGALSGAAFVATTEAALLHDRRLVVALVGALVLHLAVLGLSRSAAHADLAMPIAATMIVRMLTSAPVKPDSETATHPAATENAAAPSATALEPSTSQPLVLPDLDAGAIRTAPGRPSRPETVAPTISSPVPSESADRPSTTSKPAQTSPIRPGPPEAAPPPPPTVPPPPGLPDAPAYAFAAKLDPGPQPLSDIEPQYPPAGQNRTGKVVLRLLISETGHVDDAAVVRATPEEVFDDAALTAFRAARFAPGRMLGVAVKSQITIEVDFTPYNRGPAITGRGY